MLEKVIIVVVVAVVVLAAGVAWWFENGFFCALGTYREKVSLKVAVKVAGGTYVEKVH